MDELWMMCFDFLNRAAEVSDDVNVLLRNGYIFNHISSIMLSKYVEWFHCHTH